MYMISTIILTLAAWGVGLVLDMSIHSNPAGFLCLRVLFPVIVMGLCILHALTGKNSTDKDEDKKE